MSTEHRTRKRKRATTAPTEFAPRVLTACRDDIEVARPITLRRGSGRPDSTEAVKVIADLVSQLGASHPLANAAAATLDAEVALAALERLQEPSVVAALLALYLRHANCRDRCHALVHMTARFGEVAVEPALALCARHRDVRHLVVETFALAGVSDVRALALAFELLEEEPAQVAQFLAEWADPRAIEPLRGHLAKIDLDHVADWEVPWQITDALLTLGATLTQAERRARQSAFAHRVEPVDPSIRGTLGLCSNAMGRAPIRVASVLADLGGEQAVAMIRGALALLDRQRVEWFAFHIIDEPLLPEHPGTSRVALALLDALMSAGGVLTEIETSIHAHARATIEAFGSLAAYGTRLRSDAEIDADRRADAEEQRAEEERQAEEARRPSFSRDFDAAFLTLDEGVIRSVFDKWGFDAELPEEPMEFWAAVHGIRTAIRDLPYEARKLSREWLVAHGIQPAPDPDFDVPGPTDRLLD